MDNCYAACGCEGENVVSESDLDRWTDTIENVLNDVRGRRFFRNFMFSSNMRSGRSALELLEHTERLIEYKENSESVSYSSYLEDVDRLIDEAEKNEEIDFVTMERLTTARSSENKEAILESLKKLKQEATKSLRREYDRFRRYYAKPG